MNNYSNIVSNQTLALRVYLSGKYQINFELTSLTLYQIKNGFLYKYLNC